MARLLSIKNVQLLIRRSYAVVAENMKMQSVAASITKKGADLRSELVSDQEKGTFWMRDPKTGYWIPENHFDDIDVAELRAKLLSKKQH